MKTTLLLSLSTFVVCALLLGSVGAWRPEGHRIVAQLAQNRLTSKTWAAIQPYLPPHSNGLPDIANAPDDYARTPAGSWSFCQHYANIGINATHFYLARDCPGLCCVPFSVYNYTAVLLLNQSTEQQAAARARLSPELTAILSANQNQVPQIDAELAPTLSAENLWRGVAKPRDYYQMSIAERRAAAGLSSSSNILAGYVPEPSGLSFLVHYTGDLHQPLHVSYSCDSGGNQVQTLIFGNHTDLHFVWDEIIVEHFNPSWLGFATQLQAYLDANPHLYAEYTASMDPERWANESLNYTRHNAYDFYLSPTYQPGYPGKVCPYPSEVLLSDAYYQANLPIIQQRLMQAGVRLGHLLNLIFDPDNA